MSSQRNTILEYLVDTLFPTITTGNSYNFTVATKERGLKSYQNMSDSEFPALFVASADEDRKNISNRRFQSTMNVFIYGFVKADTSQNVQEELDKLIEDLTKALYAGQTPGAYDPTHAGKVTWTEILEIITDEGDEEPHAAFKMKVEFRYEKPGNAP